MLTDYKPKFDNTTYVKGQAMSTLEVLGVGFLLLKMQRIIKLTYVNPKYELIVLFHQ